MKTALLVLFGLVLGSIGGGALGIGAGVAWIEFFKTSSFEGYSGMLVFFTFMPIGAVLGAMTGAVLFGFVAMPKTQMVVAPRADGDR
jgi:hypothetical protein